MFSMHVAAAARCGCGAMRGVCPHGVMDMLAAADQAACPHVGKSAGGKDTRFPREKVAQARATNNSLQPASAHLVEGWTMPDSGQTIFLSASK